MGEYNITTPQGVFKITSPGNAMPTPDQLAQIPGYSTATPEKTPISAPKASPPAPMGQFGKFVTPTKVPFEGTSPVDIQGLVNSPEFKAAQPQEKSVIMDLMNRAAGQNTQSQEKEGVYDTGNTILDAQAAKGLASIGGNLASGAANIGVKYLLKRALPAQIRPFLGNLPGEVEKLISRGTAPAEQAPQFGEGLTTSAKPWNVAPKGIPSVDTLMGTKPPESLPASPSGPIPAPMQTPAPGPASSGGLAAPGGSEMTPSTAQSELNELFNKLTKQIPEVNNAPNPAETPPGATNILNIPPNKMGYTPENLSKFRQEADIASQLPPVSSQEPQGPLSGIEQLLTGSGNKEFNIETNAMHSHLRDIMQETPRVNPAKYTKK